MNPSVKFLIGACVFVVFFITFAFLGLDILAGVYAIGAIVYGLIGCWLLDKEEYENKRNQNQ